MSISCKGIGQLAITLTAGTAEEGTVCTLSSEGRACKTVEGDIICGVVQQVENGLASVVVEGFVTVSYTGYDPICGMCGLYADGNGGVYNDDDGPQYLIVEVDTANKTCAFKL